MRNVVQHSRLQKRLCGLPQFKHKHHENKFLEPRPLRRQAQGCCCQTHEGTDRTPASENNTDVTDRFLLPCYNYLFTWPKSHKSPAEMQMGANDTYFYLPPAIFQFMSVSRLPFEFLCWLIKGCTAKPARFVPWHL